MSGLVKSVTKVFKKVAKTVKSVVTSKVFMYAAAAAAVYFTAGLAIGAFGGVSGAQFVATMPGFGAGAWGSTLASSISTNFAANTALATAPGMASATAYAVAPQASMTATNLMGGSNIAYGAPAVAKTAAGSAAASGASSAGGAGSLGGFLNSGAGVAAIKAGGTMLAGYGIGEGQKAAAEEETKRAETERNFSANIDFNAVNKALGTPSSASPTFSAPTSAAPVAEAQNTGYLNPRVDPGAGLLSDPRLRVV